MHTRQQLKDFQKEKILARAKIFFNKIKVGTDTSEIIISNEKIVYC